MFFPSTRERKFSHMCATTNPHVIESTAAPFSTGVYSGPLNFVTEQNQRKWLFLPAVRSCQCRMDYTAIQHVHQNTHVVPPSPFRGRRPVARSRRLGPLGGEELQRRSKFRQVDAPRPRNRPVLRSGEEQSSQLKREPFLCVTHTVVPSGLADTLANRLNMLNWQNV